MINESQLRDILSFLQTDYGQVLIRLGLVLILAESLRLILRKFFDVILVYTETRKRLLDALTDFFAYIGNIGMSVLLGIIYTPHQTAREIVVSVVYGFASIILHWVIISGYLKKAISFIISIRFKGKGG